MIGWVYDGVFLYEIMMCFACLPLCFFGRDLGRQRSTIELDTAAVKPGEMEALEEAVNQKIRDQIRVNVQLLSLDDPAVEKVKPAWAWSCFAVV